LLFRYVQNQLSGQHALLDDLQGDLFEAISCLPEALKLQHEADIPRRGNEYVPRHTFQPWSMSLIDAMMALVILVSSMVSQLECCETELSILEDSVQNDLQTAWTQKDQLQAPCYHLGPNTFFARIGVSLAISIMESIHLCAVFLLLQPDFGPSSASAFQYSMASNKESQLRVEQCQKLLADIPLVSSPRTQVPNVGSIADLHMFLFCQPVRFYVTRL
jgi:hypothetical protein